MIHENHVNFFSISVKAPAQDNEHFYQALILSLIEENLWVSVIFKNGWTSFNRSARLTTAIFAISMISLGNVIFKIDDLNFVQIGPVQFSPRSVF